MKKKTEDRSRKTEAVTLSEAEECPRCGSDIVYEFPNRLACEECNHVWRGNDQQQVAGVIIPGEIRTYTGIVFNVLQPQPENICVEDIAHALSNQCRFSGHTAAFYSVAEHSLKCCDLVPEKHKLAALLHDASEAYLVDIPSPVKMLLPDYINLEDQLMRVIAKKFGFEYPLTNEIKRADKTWLQLEWENLMLNHNWSTLSPGDAKAVFLHRYDKLTSK